VLGAERQREGETEKQREAGVDESLALYSELLDRERRLAPRQKLRQLVGADGG
jgi:hypothetical protein